MIALPLAADDGTVLPGGVFRARVIPVYAWVPGSYDSSGTYTATSTAASAIPNGTVTVPSIGFALEYGITSWMSAGLQWAPAINFSTVVPQSAYAGAANMDGLSDLFAGLEVQIVGPKAPVASDTLRFAVAAGVNIPFGGADFAKQATNAATGSAFLVQNPDIQTLGYGGRAWLDYVVSKSFFIDLYSQFIDYPGTVALKDSSLTGYKQYAGLGGFNPDVGYGYTLRFELDPHYNVDISDGISFAANCAFRYDATPAVTWSKTSPVPSIAPSPATTYWSANPSLDFFFYKSLVPFEIDLEYGQPLAGTSTSQAYSLDMQIKVYFKF